jgi:hypothetical protein
MRRVGQANEGAVLRPQLKARAEIISARLLLCRFHFLKTAARNSTRSTQRHIRQRFGIINIPAGMTCKQMTGV